MEEWKQSIVKWQADWGPMGVLEGIMESAFATLAKLGNCPGCLPPLVQHPLAHPAWYQGCLSRHFL